VNSHREFTIILEDTHDGKWGKFGSKMKLSFYESFLKTGRNIKLVEDNLDRAFHQIKRTYVSREKFLNTLWKLGLLNDSTTR